MPSYSAGTIDAKLTLDRSAFTKGIAEARRQAKSLDGKDISANLDLDKAKFEAELARVKQQLQALDRQTVEPKVTLDKGGLMTRRISLLKTALVGLAPAGIPILAGLTAATLGLAGALAGAAGGVGVFGLALGGNVLEAGKMSAEITKLNKQLDATEDIAKRSAIYDKLAKVWARMDDSQKEFVTTLQHTKTVWEGFLTATRPQTLGLATRALELLPAALGPLPGLVSTMTPVFDDWLSGIEDFVRGPGYRGFINFIAKEGPPALQNLGDLVGNVATGVGSLVRTFTPFGQDFLSALTEGSAKFATWSQQLGSTGGFQTFMDFIAATGPQVVDTLAAVSGAIISVGVALAPLGGPTLEVIKVLAESLSAIAAIAPGLLQFALVAGTVARGIGAISDAQVAIGKRTDRFKAVFADAVGPMAKFKAGLGGALGLIGGPWGLALAGGTIALGLFANAHAKAEQQQQELASSLDQATGSITSQSRAVVAGILAEKGAFESARRLGLSQTDLTNAALGNEDALLRVNTALDGMESGLQTNRSGARVAAGEQDRLKNSITNVRDVIGGTNSTIEDQRAIIDAAAKSAGGYASAIDDTKFATAEAAAAYDKQRQAIEGTIAALQASIDKQKEARNVALGLVNAQIGLEQAIDDAQKSAKDNGKTTDINTQKGRDNKEALIGVASAINEVVDSEKFRLQNAPAQLKILDTQRDRFVKIATSMGVSKAAAKALADELIKTPKEISTEVKLKTDQKALEKVKADAKALDGKTVTTTAKFVTDDKNVAAYQAALGGIPPDKPTKAHFANDNKNIAAYLGALGTLPPVKQTDGKFVAPIGVVNGYLAALGTLPPVKPTKGDFTDDKPAVLDWEGTLGNIPHQINSTGQFSTAGGGALDSWIGRLGNIPRHITTYVGVSISGQNQRLLNGAASGGIVGGGGVIQHSFAGGGVVPGYAPGVDSRIARVSPGEGILRPEVVRALGAGTIHAWNRAARRGEMGGERPDVKVRVNQPQSRGFVIENYHSTTVTQSSEDALMDTAQELSLMFGGV